MHFLIYFMLHFLREVYICLKLLLLELILDLKSLYICFYTFYVKFQIYVKGDFMLLGKKPWTEFT